MSLEEKLRRAIDNNDEESIRNLIAQRVDVNAYHENRGRYQYFEQITHQTSLHRAIKQQSPNKNIIRLLLEAGANPNAIYEESFLESCYGAGDEKTVFAV